MQSAMSETQVQDLTDRIFILKENIESGKMKFASHLVNDFMKSFESIRLRPDGLVDPTTVDGRIRSATLAIRAMQYRNEVKNSSSINDIQVAYFNILFREFGDLYGMMIKANSDPYKASEFFSLNAEISQGIIDGCDDFFIAIKEFWSELSEVGLFNLQDGEQLKANFAGDLFPSYDENAVSIAGLYIDTIILPCPITRISPLKGKISDRDLVRVLLKHVFTAMTYRELATEDIKPNIVVILPNQSDFDDEARFGLLKRNTHLILKHGSYLFERDFDSLEHLGDYCHSLKTVDQVLQTVKRPERILFDVEWGRGAKNQLERAISDKRISIPNVDPTIAGNQLYAACIGRIPQACAALENSLALGGTPFINAETSWQYYTWLLEYESKPNQTDESLHIVHALASENNNDLAWLGRVPPESILKIRRNGLAEEIRSLLSDGIGELIRNRPGDYYSTAERITNNLDLAFREHKKKILEAKRERLKLYGVDVSVCAVVGTIAVAAAITANPVLAATSAAISMVGAPNLIGIKSKFKSLKEAQNRHRSSPTGILFSHLD
ncbi:TPA: hypothetical protein ACKQFD_004645 [Serratia marcescens]|nr:hypothetical protein [Serratia marcescens]HEJ7177339.1 hypothetical protein [Serratia marcescens]HEJ9045810.1 hypothetical protein [Serratia marcescens]